MAKREITIALEYTFYHTVEVEDTDAEGLPRPTEDMEKEAFELAECDWGYSEFNDWRVVNV